MTALSLFLTCPPGLEPVLADEARSLDFTDPQVTPGGVVVRGDWPEAWRANLWLRGASRVLVRLGTFHAAHLAELDKRARQLEWGATLTPHSPVRVEAVCRRSKIYHSGAAAQRIGDAITAATGAPISTEGPVKVLVRIDQDTCTVSVDTSGDLLHKRGFKRAVNAAPLRETMAALFLRASGYVGDRPLVDPMCGSGTLVIEAAELATTRAPGRARSFAFERLATFNAEQWAQMRADAVHKQAQPSSDGPIGFGYDRDGGAVAMSRANAERAGFSGDVVFTRQAVTALKPPEGPAGLVMVNPPYGGRIGRSAQLRALYRALGHVVQTRFTGWRVSLITSGPEFARATGLPLLPPGPPIPHGGLKVRLYQTDALS